MMTILSLGNKTKKLKKKSFSWPVGIATSSLLLTHAREISKFVVFPRKIRNEEKKKIKGGYSQFLYFDILSLLKLTGNRESFQTAEKYSTNEFISKTR